MAVIRKSQIISMEYEPTNISTIITHPQHCRALSIIVPLLLLPSHWLSFSKNNANWHDKFVFIPDSATMFSGIVHFVAGYLLTGKRKSTLHKNNGRLVSQFLTPFHLLNPIRQRKDEILQGNIFIYLTFDGIHWKDDEHTHPREL